MPTVSVIMPAYDSAAYIGKAIGSVVAQTYREYELIVVDDGSTDDTRSVIEGFGARVVLLEQPNRGPSAARNHGLRVAQGDYVAFLDSDDEWDPFHLAALVPALDRCAPDVAGVCTGWAFTDRDGQILTHTRQAGFGHLGLREFLATNPVPIHAVLVRRSEIVAAAAFDEAMLGMEDWDLWLRIAASGRTFFQLGHRLSTYRLHGESQSRNPDRMRSGRLRALDKLFDRTDLPADVRADEARSYAAALRQSSADLYAAGRDTEARADLCEAIRRYPAILRDDETYYSVACADQPVGLKATGFPVNLTIAEQRLLSAIRGGLRSTEVFGGAPEHQTSAKAYTVLAKLAIRQNQLSLAGRFICLRLKCDFHVGDTMRLLVSLVRRALSVHMHRARLGKDGIPTGQGSSG